MTGTGHRSPEDGQAAVEVVLAMPLVAMMLMAVVQVGVLVRDQILVVHAAREGAREAAVDAAPESPRRAAIAGSRLSGNRLRVTVTGRGGAGSRVKVGIAYTAPTDVPLVGPLLGDVELGAEATMRVER